MTSTCRYCKTQYNDTTDRQQGTSTRCCNTCILTRYAQPRTKKLLTISSKIRSKEKYIIKRDRAVIISKLGSYCHTCNKTLKHNQINICRTSSNYSYPLLKRLTILCNSCYTHKYNLKRK